MKTKTISLWKFLVATALFVGLSFTAFAADNTYEVDDLGDAGDANAGDGFCATGGAVCTFRAAIEEANASAGSDEITFDAALYGGGAATINIIGTIEVTDNDVTITGPGGGDIVLDFNGNTGVVAQWGGQADNFSISGMTLTNTGDGPCLSIGDSANAVVSNNVISSCHTEGISVDSDMGTADGITITGNTVSNVGTGALGNDQALEVLGTNVISNLVVTNNTFTGVSGSATVSIWPSGANGYTGITFTGNTVNGGEDCVQADNITNGIFSDNILVNPEADALEFSNMDTITVQGNTITGTDSEAIEFDDSANITIGGPDPADGNTVSSATAGDGISLETVAGGTIQNNSVTLGATAARSLVCSTCTSFTISDNTFSSAGDGVQTVILYSGSGNTIDGNNVTTTGSGALTVGLAILEAATAITDNTVTGGGTSEGYGITVISDGSSTTFTGNSVSNIGVAYQFGLSTITASAINFTMSSTNTLSTAGTGVLFDYDITASNTLDGMTFPDSVTTHISSAVAAASTNNLVNVSYDPAKISITSGVIDVNYKVRAYVANDGTPIENVTVSATDVLAASTSLGLTDVLGYTAYTSLDSHQIDSTGIINGKNGYTFSGTHATLANTVALTASVSSQDQNVSLSLYDHGASYSPMAYDSTDYDDALIYSCNLAGDGQEITADDTSVACVDAVNDFNWAVVAITGGASAGEKWTLLLRNDVFTDDSALETWLDQHTDAGAGNYTIDYSSLDTDWVTNNNATDDYIFDFPSVLSYAASATDPGYLTYGKGPQKTISISVDNTTLYEDGSVPTATITLTLSEAISRDVTVIVSFAGSTGVNGTHYSENIVNVDNEVTISAGETTATFTITSLDESVTSGSNRNVYITLDPSVNASVASAGALTITLTDNDTGGSSNVGMNPVSTPSVTPPEVVVVVLPEDDPEAIIDLPIIIEDEEEEEPEPVTPPTTEEQKGAIDDAIKTIGDSVGSVIGTTPAPSAPAASSSGGGSSSQILEDEEEEKAIVPGPVISEEELQEVITELDIDETSDLDGDGISDVVAVMYNIPLFNDDADGDGYTNSEEIYMGFDPNKYNHAPETPDITNLDGMTVGSWPSFRLRGKKNDDVSVTLIDQESFDGGDIVEEAVVGSSMIDEKNKGEVHTKYPLADGKYYAVARGTDGYGEVISFNVDSSLDAFAPEFTGTELTEDDLLLGFYTDMTITYWNGKVGNFDSKSYIAQRSGTRNVLIVRGYAEPRNVVYVTMRSMVYSSVVLSDASGYFEARIYPSEDLREEEHTVLSYVGDSKQGWLSSVSEAPIRLR